MFLVVVVGHFSRFFFLSGASGTGSGSSTEVKGGSSQPAIQPAPEVRPGLSGFFGIFGCFWVLSAVRLFGLYVVDLTDEALFSVLGMTQNRSRSYGSTRRPWRALSTRFDSVCVVCVFLCDCRRFDVWCPSATCVCVSLVLDGADPSSLVVLALDRLC